MRMHHTATHLQAMQIEEGVSLAGKREAQCATDVSRLTSADCHASTAAITAFFLEAPWGMHGSAPAASKGPNAPLATLVTADLQPTHVNQQQHATNTRQPPTAATCDQHTSASNSCNMQPNSDHIPPTSRNTTPTS